MEVALFVPCYIDQFYPGVGMASVELLERLKLDVAFPVSQTCCGQPLLNSGMCHEARPIAERFVQTFKDYDYVVCPSGSCTSMVRNHYGDLVGDQAAYRKFQGKVFELCEFIHDVLELRSLPGVFNHRVGLHQSCHGLRELRLEGSSELMSTSASKVQSLLGSIEGLKLVPLTRKDECCGFGGLFSVNEPEVSVSMGRDRLDDHQKAEAEIVASVDMSCLMHLEGLIRREGRPLKAMHVAEILAEATR